MPLIPEEVEVPRTSAELRAFVDHVRSVARADRTEFELGMLKRGYYKEFLNEVEPLCRFAEAAYPLTYKVQPILGNQGYDAVVFDAQGNEVEKLEFANPHDGAAMAESARQVVARGYSDLQVIDHTEVLEELIPFFEATAKAKSLKDYGGITLVFSLAAPESLPGVEASFELQLVRICSIIAANRFRAKRVLLYVPPGRIIPIDG